MDEENPAHEIGMLRIRHGLSLAADNISGALLDTDMVQNARDVEMEYFRRMKVYVKVDRASARGQTTVRTKWVDISKGDVMKPDYRSRLVATKFNEYPDPSLFAATPPLEARRFLLHNAATIEGGPRNAR